MCVCVWGGVMWQRGLVGGRLLGFRGRWEGGYGGRGSGREVIGGRGRLWGRVEGGYGGGE